MNANASHGLIYDAQDRATRTRHKHELVLGWLAQEPFTNAGIVGEVLGLQRNAVWKTLRAMEREGLLRKELVDLPLLGSTPLWVLTPHGALMATPEGESPRPYFESGRIAPATIAHALDVQRARLRAEQAGWTEWRGDWELHHDAGGAKWPKIPDAIVRSNEGVLVAIEVERTAKTAKRYAGIMAEYLMMMKARQVERVHYVVPTPGLAVRLARLFASIESVRVEGRSWPVTEQHRDRFSFFDLQDWPRAE